MSEKWFEIFKAKAGSKTTKVVLYDDIGMWGISAKAFTAELDKIKTPRIDLHINSYGGEIIDGLACFNALKNHKAEVTVHVDGLAASIASVIALAGDKVCIAKNAFMMIHNGWSMVVGDPSEMRKQADVLEKLCGSIADAYTEKTGKSLDDVKAAMDAETWFTAAEAKAWGLVDEIEGEADVDKLAASAFRAVAKYQKVPPKLRKFAARAEKNSIPQAKGKQVMEKLVCREGKWFLGDDEVDASAALEAGKASVPAPVIPDVAKAREEGIAAGRKAEAEYRAMFNTVVATAKLNPTAAAEFEKEFYGRAESDLKFLASHAIGQRAVPVGESNPGNGEGEQPTDAEKEAKQIEADATKRFAAEPNVRRIFGLQTSVNAEDPAYKSALARYVAREKQWAKDQKANGTTVAK